jgi:hypothetical protein
MRCVALRQGLTGSEMSNKLLQDIADCLFIIKFELLVLIVIAVLILLLN